jgi:hypothetical protein
MCLFKKRKLKKKAHDCIYKLISTNELATVEYTFSKVVKPRSNDSRWKRILGDRKKLVKYTVIVKAGIDLRKYNPESTKIDTTNMAISLVLPKANIISFNMLIESGVVVYEKIGLMRKQFTQEENMEYAQLAEADLREKIYEKDEYHILQNAENSADSFFSIALHQLGYQSVNIKFE